MSSTESDQSPDDLWLDLLDVIDEIKSDMKTRRGKRHVSELERIVKEIGLLITRVTQQKKRSFLR